jgi:uncharacterized membrane protein YdjX (TVP38/TMEM64 family)
MAAAGVLVLFEIRNPSRIISALSEGQGHLHVLVAKLGFWGPLLFMAGYCALMLMIWVPSWPCTLIGGFLFGPVPATIYSLIATTLGAMGVFALARSGLAHRIALESPFLRKLDAEFKRNAFEYVVALRILPIVPFGIVHVAAAVLGVSLRVFTLGTIVGMVPGIIIYAILGADLDRIAAAGQALDATTFLKPNVIGPLFALAALIVVPILVRRFRALRSRPGGPPA